MTKWTGPLSDPKPEYKLDVQLELKLEDEPPKLSRSEFVITCLGILKKLVYSHGAYGILANTVNETGWGQKYRGFNLGGWTIQSAQPVGTKWYRAHGNKSSGDPQTVIYKGFSSFEDFFVAWIDKFLPKENKGRYGLTGRLFWERKPWFPAIIQASYKGPVTKADPEGSILEHQYIIDCLENFWCQHQLNLWATTSNLVNFIPLKVDGNWGRKSAELFIKWSEVTGEKYRKKLIEAE